MRDCRAVAERDCGPLARAKVYARSFRQFPSPRKIPRCPRHLEMRSARPKIAEHRSNCAFGVIEYISTACLIMWCAHCPN